MKRINLIVLSFLLAGCSSRPQNLSAVLPAEAEGWTRQHVSAMAAGEAPESVRAVGLVQWATADYSHGAKGRITVEIFEMKGETSAFEQQQKFHAPDSFSFYKGPLFVVVNRGTAEMPDARTFTRALEARLTRGG